MLPGRRYTPADIWEIALRHKWLILIPWVVVAVGVAIFTRSLEDRYVSESLLQIIAQRVPQNLVRSTVTTSIEERLPVITQQIMSRTKLERIVQDFGLYQDDRKAGRLMEDIIRDMREKHIGVRPIKGDAFRISFESSDARLAMRVTEKLASFFVEENMRDREMQAENTNQFLDSQLDEARRRLTESERKVAEYRKEHTGELPTQLQSNLQQQQSLEQQLANTREAFFRDRDERVRKLRAIEDAEAELATSQQSAALAAAADSGAPVEMPIAAQLAKLKAQRQQMALTYTADYPDMRRVDNMIRELEAKAEAEAIAVPVSATPNLRPRTPADAARIRRIAELKSELTALDQQIAQRDALAKQLTGKIAEVQRRIDATPEHESELIAITRDYETLGEIYTGLLSKSEDAKVAANLERRQIGEQFKVIDPARLPERPASPDRVRFYVGGVLGGLFVGLALAGLLEYRDSSFRTDTDIVTVLALPVLATIPAIMTREDRAFQKRRKRIQLAAAGVVALMAIAAVAVWRMGLLQRLL